MPEFPLLIFPTPENASKSTLSGGGSHFRKPTPKQQWDRLSPKFNQLQESFIAVQQNTVGIDPEEVLVIETIGSIEAFANAVKKITGLEWLGEIEIEEISPDQDFFDEDNPDKDLSGRLYLIMTNQQALNEMLSLWRRYQENPQNSFDRGLAKFKTVFDNLKNIRRWSIQDRLLETGLLDIWKEELQYDGDRFLSFEVELWFRKTPEQRRTSSEHVTNIIQNLGGNVVHQSMIDGISYHGILANLPANVIRTIIDDNSVELVQCSNIMFFRPVGQIVVGDNLIEGEIENIEFDNLPLPTGEPIIALLDGMPLNNHELLTGRIIIDDPDNWESDYKSSERSHGTSMASLIIHGDLNERTQPLPQPIYIRPIMKPKPTLRSQRLEGVPENCLIVDYIHRVVKRILEGENDEQPVARYIKIINLSICDPARQYFNTMSPFARLIDWLSVKYNVLFIVSAGNHTAPIALDLSYDEFNSLNPTQREEIVVKSIIRDIRNRRILSPAESINAITVGAFHNDDSNILQFGNRFDPYEHVFPSPISAFGSGFRRSVKPDIIFNGGKQLYKLPIMRSEPLTIEPSIFRSAPGNKSASPGSQAGDLSATTYSCGTSNATALITGKSGVCYNLLKMILDEQNIQIDSAYIEVPLLKAMLVHGCSWSDIGSRISELLSTQENNNKLRSLISRWMGYGIPQINRVLECTEQRATLLGFGSLLNGQAHIFRLPLPPSLSSRSEWRRLTVTLAWLSPIAPKTQKYRTSSLWFEVGATSPAKDRKEFCSGTDGWRAVRRGTVQHEVFEGQRAEPFTDGDSIEIKVNCREDAGKITNAIAYGLVVSLEVAEGIEIPIYNEIKTRISTMIHINQ